MDLTERLEVRIDSGSKALLKKAAQRYHDSELSLF